MGDEFGPSPDDMGVDFEGNMIDETDKKSTEPQPTQVEEDLEAKKDKIDQVR